MSLVALIRDCVKPYPKPCVYIGGGLDSAIILHHLLEKVKEPVYTYTFGFEGEDNEFRDAWEVADYYETRHKSILIRNMLEEYPNILRHFQRPQFNIWLWWEAKQAAEDGRRNCYCGEGGDEHFGGYWYKPRVSYIEGWMGLLQWGLPSYLEIHRVFNLQLQCPFLNLDWRETYRYFDYEQHKRYLREAYQGVLPTFILNRKKRAASRNYFALWQNELSKYFPKLNQNPHSEAEIRELLNIWVTREWLKVHET